MAEQIAAPAVHAAPQRSAESVWYQPEQASLRLLTRLKFALARGFLLALAWLVGLRGLYLFGQAFGTCEWLINYRLRRRVRERLRYLLGERISDKDLSRAVHRFFMRVRCDKIIYLIFDRLPREKVLERIHFEGRQYVDEALQRGKGCYVMMSHHGAHHVAALLMALMGYNVAGVRDRKESALRKYAQAKYAQTFPEFSRLRMFYADAFPRSLYRCFRENFVVGSALDVNRDRGKHLRTVDVTLFGRPHRFLTGTLHIALRCGATILQGFVISCKDFHFRLVVTPPLIDPDEAVDSAETVRTIMQRYASGIERHVQAYPCHISKF